MNFIKMLERIDKLIIFGLLIIINLIEILFLNKTVILIYNIITEETIWKSERWLK